MFGIKLGKYTIVDTDCKSCSITTSNWFRTTLERNTMTGRFTVSTLTINVLFRLLTGQLIAKVPMATRKIIVGVDVPLGCDGVVEFELDSPQQRAAHQLIADRTGCMCGIATGCDVCGYTEAELTKDQRRAYREQNRFDHANSNLQCSIIYQAHTEAIEHDKANYGLLECFECDEINMITSPTCPGCTVCCPFEVFDDIPY